MSASKPLDGVRVIDISTSYAAPVAAMYLADLGADVIKVERPVVGDDTRHWGPPFSNGESAWFLSANRDKQSLCLDISSPAGHDVLIRMLEDADVFIENINPGKLERLGLDPADLTARFPKLIYCSISGYGLTGPDRELPGYDLIAQAGSGLMSVTGARGGLPQRMSTALSDVAAGTQAALAVCAALVRQQRTGEGEIVDVSLLEADLALLAPRIASYLMGAPEPEPCDATDSVLTVYQVFSTSDRPIVVAVGNDRMWVRFCQAIGLPDLADDERLRTNEGRVEHRETILPAISEALRTRPSQEWLDVLGELGVPCARIASLSEVVDSPQVKARGAIVRSTHPVAGPTGLVTSPWRLGSLDRTCIRPAPALGEHGREVLLGSGLTAEEIDRLVADDVVWLPQTDTLPLDQHRSTMLLSGYDSDTATSEDHLCGPQLPQPCPGSEGQGP
jgi:crotonobetainyl-CoA:carnitine CoA-transferase CaiB-like acyl-CoA transferase